VDEEMSVWMKTHDSLLYPHVYYSFMYKLGTGTNGKKVRDRFQCMRMGMVYIGCDIWMKNYKY
jgi:hypothetical protein